MRAIGKIERSYPGGTELGPSEGPAESSYHPLSPAPCIATDNDSTKSKVTAEPLKTDSSSWLPCHYFDYMAGTSTGGYGHSTDGIENKLIIYKVDQYNAWTTTNEHR